MPPEAAEERGRKLRRLRWFLLLDLRENAQKTKKTRDFHMLNEIFSKNLSKPLDRELPICYNATR